MFSIKLIGLSDVDASSLKSMLSLAKDLLSHQWEVVDTEQADLAVYSFDNEEGIQAWNNRKEGLTALLSKTGNISEPVDIVIKKPLRTSNFSDALNLLAEKLSPSQVEPVKPVSIVKPLPEAKTSVFTNLSKGINKYLPTKPSHKRSAIIVDIPEFSAQTTESIVEIEALETWLSSIPKKHNQENVTNLLTNLVSLNRLDIPTSIRADLMAVYDPFIVELLADKELSVECRTSEELKLEAELIKSSLLLLEELNHGYKRIVNECINVKEKPDSSPLLLYAIVKVAEVTGMLILYSYQHYRSQPQHHFKQLHQLYSYCEMMGVLDTKPDYKSNKINCTFTDLYKQTILISIADPYNLERFEASRLFSLLKKIAAHAEIKLLTQNQIEATSDFFMTGHFCIDIDADAIPKAMNKTPVETRQKKTSRLLNIHPVLLHLEKIFKQTSAIAFGGSFDLDIKLLKKVTPQLNTTYERRYQRTESTHSQSVKLIQGIQNIHDAIREGQLNNSTAWNLKNQSGAGLMLSRQVTDRPGLYIGDILAISEPNQPIKIVIVRWLHIDQDDMIYLGVQLMMGQPIHVVCTPSNDTNIYPGLLFPEDEYNSKKLLVTDKGVYTEKRAIRISGDGEPYIAVLSKLIESSYYFEKFDFKVKSAS